jgi:hypothetical protein
MTKPAITKRTEKGLALTYAELDTNFQNLRDATISLTADTGGTQVISDLNGNITLVAGTGVTLTGDNTAKTITITNSSLGANAFGKIVVAGQSDVDADTTGDTLTLVAGSNVTLTTDASTDSVTISTSVSGITNPLTSDLNVGTFDIVNTQTNGTLSIESDFLYLKSGFVFVGSDDSSGAALITDNPSLEIGINGSLFNAISITDSAVFIGNEDSGTGTIFLDNNVQCRKTFLSPVMTTTERNGLTASNGFLIYNSTDNKFQGYAGGSWVDLH